MYLHLLVSTKLYNQNLPKSIINEVLTTRLVSTNREVISTLTCTSVASNSTSDSKRY